MVKFWDPVQEKTLTYHINKFMVKQLDHVIDVINNKDKDRHWAGDGFEGAGKCQPKGSKVLMANGVYKNIEDVKVGDLVLSPQKDGSQVFSKVLEIHNWFSKKTYDIFEKNRSKKKLYSCSYNHLIPLNIKKTFRNKSKNKWVVEEFKAEDLFKKKDNFFVNTTTPTMFPIDKFKDRKNCKIEPYTLGVFLGDGSFRDTYAKRNNYKGNLIRNMSPYVKVMKSGKIVNVHAYQSKFSNPNDNNGYCRSRALNITSADFGVMKEVSKFYPVMSIYNKKGTIAKHYRFSVVGKLSNQLDKCNLNGKGSGTKFIPKEAMLSDLEYRKRLLAGLVDTDGYYNKKSNGYEFTLKSKQLIKDIRDLAYSLGGRCGEIKKVKKRIKSINFIGTYYRISFNLGKMKLPLQLKRKIRERDYSFFYKSPNRVSIKLKQNCGKQVYGFTLDSESHWYITDNFTITHNSVLLMQFCKYVDPTFNIDRVCFSPEEFKTAIDKAKKGQAILYDEAFTGLSSRSSLSKTNIDLVSKMMQMRQKNLFICVALPSIFMMDKYAAMFRTRALISVYETRGMHMYTVFNRSFKKRLILEGKRNMSYNQTVKLMPQKCRGLKFYGKYVIDEQTYRDKKEKALKENVESKGGDIGIYDRNRLIYLIHKEYNLNGREISELFDKYGFPLKQRQIERIIIKMREEKGGKDDE